jgi:hypothetical protein
MKIGTYIQAAWLTLVKIVIFVFSTVTTSNFIMGLVQTDSQINALLYMLRFYLF